MTSLVDKLHGAEVATAVASSMGDLCADLTQGEIQERYGQVRTLLSQEGKWADRSEEDVRASNVAFHVHDRPAGMTNAGHERHRLLVTAVVEHGVAVTAEQLAGVWLRDIDPDRFGYLLSPDDATIYQALKAGVPPWEAGRFATRPGTFAPGRMAIPIGLVNAGDPRRAAIQASALGQLCDVRGQSGNHAVAAGAALAAGAAEAMRADASVDSVVAAVLAESVPALAKRIERALRSIEGTSDGTDAEFLIDTERGTDPRDAAEVLASGLALFRLSGARVEQAITWSVNLGLGADARAYVAGGLAGALSGIDGIPAAWGETVSAQVVDDPYTVSRRTPAEAAAGLRRAMVAGAEHGLAQLRKLAFSPAG